MSNVTYCRYIVVKSVYITNLEAEVNSLLDQGYIPSGGMQIEIGTYDNTYYQPMILPST